MTLVEDNVARRYKINRLRAEIPNLTKPLLLVCLPIALLVSGALCRYDSERPHSWVIALLAIPAMISILCALPYFFYLFSDRWILGEDHVTFRGSRYARLKNTEQVKWEIARIEDLPGYFHLGLRTANIRASIFLSDESFPIETIRDHFDNKFGEQGGDGDAEEAV